MKKLGTKISNKLGAQLGTRLKNQLLQIALHLLTLSVGFGLLTSALGHRDSEASRADKVPAFKVTSLGNYRGQYLTVYYVVGFRPFLTTQNNNITIAEVRKAIQTQINSDSLDFPSIELTKTGIKASYNFVVLVTSSQKNFTWKNSNGSTPEGLVESNNHQSNQVAIVDRNTLEALNPAVISID